MNILVAISGSDRMILDGLCRLQLAACRWGGVVRVHDPAPQTVDLLELCGLTDVLLGDLRWSVEERAQHHHRPEPNGDSDERA